MNTFWFGFLDTGDGKTLVVRNMLVDADNRNTIFLYNQQRDALVEYSREIIEPKLLPANGDEFSAAELEKAYKRALRKKRPNTYNLLYRSAKISTRRSASNDETLELDDDMDADDDALMAESFGDD